MNAINKFIIKRKDLEIDDVIIENEGLTIGRVITNDLVLNHRTVSRTHAGIKDLNGQYWLFNLSTSNGTFLNGEPVERTPMTDNDVIQIGCYTIQVQYLQDALSLTVQIEIDVQAEGHTGLLTGQSGTLDQSNASTV